MALSELQTLPVIGTPDDGGGWLFSFGAYGTTRLVVFARHLEGALEQGLEWLDDNAPGLLSWVDYAGAARDLGVSWSSDDPDTIERVVNAAEVDMTMVSHTTLKNGNCIPSWEWTVNPLSPHEGREIHGRRFAGLESEAHARALASLILALHEPGEIWTACRVARRLTGADLAGYLGGYHFKDYQDSSGEFDEYDCDLDALKSEAAAFLGEP